MESREVREAVRERYGRKATGEDSCCEPTCCGGGTSDAGALAGSLGYGAEDLASVPVGSNLGLGCGNPVALAELSPGEVVVDLGAGGGFDCFLAAGRVGPAGRVIGVDMTPEMVERARANAAEGDFGHVEFRLGEIEALPVGDGLADVIISNCVLNLSADRPRALAEAFRVLKPGGRLRISDLVTTQAVPAFVAESREAFVGCLPVPVLEYEADLARAGFVDTLVEVGEPYPADHIYADHEVSAVLQDHPERAAELDRFVGEVRRGLIRAVKPGGSAS